MTLGRASCAALLVALFLAGAVGAADPTAGVNPAATATAALPIALPDVAAKSDELAVYLAQVDERWQPGPEIQEIATGLPAIAAQIHDRAAATRRLLSGNPTLRDVDNLSEKWRQLRAQLDGWSTALTGLAMALDKEMGGLDELQQQPGAMAEDVLADEIELLARRRNGGAYRGADALGRIGRPHRAAIGQQQATKAWRRTLSRSRSGARIAADRATT